MAKADVASLAQELDQFVYDYEYWDYYDVYDTREEGLEDMMRTLNWSPQYILDYLKGRLSDFPGKEGKEDRALIRSLIKSVAQLA